MAASLLDIAPRQRVVTVSGVDLPVGGLSLSDLSMLLYRFPALRLLLSGQIATLTADDLAQTGPEVVAALIAAGTGDAGDNEHELAAAALPLLDQAALLEAILSETFPAGVKNGLARLTALVASVGLAEPTAG